MPSLTPSPCKDCEDKYIGCHADCEKYIEYTKRQKELKKKVDAERRINSVYIDRKVQSNVKKEKKKRK